MIAKSNIVGIKSLPHHLPAKEFLYLIVLVWHIRYTAEVMNGYKSGRGGKSILRYQR